MKRPPQNLVLTVVLHCIVGGVGSYHYTVMNSLEPFIRKFANESISSHYARFKSESQIALIWSTMSTIFLVGGILGSLSIKFLVENFGRRMSMMVIKNVILIVACFLQFIAYFIVSIELLFIGRFLVGFASGPNLFLPIYVAECAPTEFRGIASACAALGLQFAGMLGTVAGLPQVLGTENGWPYALLLAVIPAFIHMAFTPLVHESPKYLYIVKRNKEKCIKALRFYHGSEVDVEKILEEYESEMDVGQSEQKTASLAQIFKLRHLRWPFFLCLVISMSIACDGSNIGYQYSTGIMMQLFSAENAALFTVFLIQVPSIVAAAVGMGVVEMSGRRLLFLSGLASCAVGTVFLWISGLLNTERPAMALNVCGLILILVGDNFGPAILRTFMAGELCPQASRSLTATAMFIFQYLSSTLASFYYPPANEAIGSWSILPFTVLCCATLIFLFLFMPETKDKTVDDVVARWIEEDEEKKPLLANHDSAD